MHLMVRMMPGWRDSRLTSKRCIELLSVEGDRVARFQAISAVFLDAQGWLLIEGQGGWLKNDSGVCPLIPRLRMRTVDGDDLLPC